MTDAILQGVIYLPPGTKAIPTTVNGASWVVVYGRGEEVLTIHCLKDRDMADGIAAAINGKAEE